MTNTPCRLVRRCKRNRGCHRPPPNTMRRHHVAAGLPCICRGLAGPMCARICRWTQKRAAARHAKCADRAHCPCGHAAPCSYWRLLCCHTAAPTCKMQYKCFSVFFGSAHAQPFFLEFVHVCMCATTFALENMLEGAHRGMSSSGNSVLDMAYLCR